jgi:threonine/homoserine/homoserine lactone efflux protein
VLQLVLLGAGFAFAAAVQPGPLQAFLLARVLRYGWRRTLPAAFAPVISDGPIAVLMLLVLRTMPAGAQRGLRVSGGVYLLWLAWSAFREARLGGPAAQRLPAPPRTLLKAVIVNLLNPNPYLGWAFVLGPAAIAAWTPSPPHAVVLVASFYLTMTITLGAFIAACGSASLLSGRTQRVLMLASAACLAGLGVWQLVVGMGRVVGSRQ